jgi:hypothetical protein
MIKAMMGGWQEKYGTMPDIGSISMGADPVPPSLPPGAMRKIMSVQDVTKP